MRDLSVIQAAQGNRIVVLYEQGENFSRPPSLISKKIAPKRRRWRTKKDLLEAIRFSSAVLSECGRQRGKGNIDLIHVHGDVGEVAGALLVARNRTPVVLTLHAGLNHKAVYALFAKGLFRRLAAVICVSGDIARRVRELGVAADRVHVIPSGIDYELFVSRSRDLGAARDFLNSPHPLRIVSVGRLVPMKGYVFLIEALAKLADKFPAELTLVGEGPDRAELLRLAEKCRVSVKCLGRLDKKEIAGLLPNFDVFVSSSVTLPQQQEGTPTVIMEAMAAGLPVIATDVGGAKNLIESGINGYIVNEKNSESLAQALLALSSSKSLMEQMAVSNRNKAREFDWGVVAQKVQRVYDQAIVG